MSVDIHPQSKLPSRVTLLSTGLKYHVSISIRQFCLSHWGIREKTKEVIKTLIKFQRSRYKTKSDTYDSPTE
jgi:hypothetical protein